MNRDQKAAVIDEIAADITASQAIFAVDYRGITVAQAKELRERLRAADASFRVVKNSLTERAADQAGAEHLKALLQGPTALTFARGDAAAAAKAVADFARTIDLLSFKGGLMDGAALSSADVGAISRLPSRHTLYGQLVGMVASPIVGLARTLNALIGGLAIGLGGVLAQKAAAAPTPEPEPVVAAEDVPAEAEAVAPEATEEVPADAEAPEPEAVVATEEVPAEAEAEAPAQEAVAATEDVPADAEADAEAEAPAPEAVAATEDVPADADEASTPEPQGEAVGDTDNESDPGGDAVGDDTSKE